MFFILSQILSFLIMPFTWITALILLALFLKNRKWSKRCLIYAVVVTLFFSNSFISDEFIRLWEYPITLNDEMEESYDVGIVLGGGMITIDAQTKRMTFRNNVDRVLQAVELYKRGKIKKILFSSGSGSLVYRDMLESALLRKYVISIGIPDSVILVDSISDNTYQNAIYCADILKKDCPKGKYLLITSSIHMRRAIGCFKKAGIEVTPYSTDKRTGKRIFDFKHYLIPSIEALSAWNSFIHEIIGYLMYAVRGYL
jgi:uncharacterized SAM-binding protein YcdF (DUF218 family)